MEIFTFESLDREDILIYSLIVRRLIVLLETNDEVEFSWDDIHGIFQTTINPNYIESAIDRLYDLNVIEGFTSGDGGGYIPRTFIRNVNYSKAMAIIDTHLKMLNDDFLKQKSELDDCQKKYNDIISFDPASIKDTINDAESKIGEIYELAEKNELIKSMIPTVNIIEKYLKDINKVNSIYDSVYRNIVNPIKNEGKSGIRATTIWAIIGIIVTTIISILVTLFFPK